MGSEVSAEEIPSNVVDIGVGFDFCSVGVFLFAAVVNQL